jgi:flagellar hook-associated protein 1 FlgK
VSDDTQYDVGRIVDSDTATIVEFFDTETNTSIATRTLDQFGKATAAGYKIDLNGIAAYDDQFFIASNNNGVGDNRNIQSLIARQSSDADGANTGGFQEIFGTIVASLGSKIQSSKYASEAAQTLKDASLEAEASYSGVNLDTEASRLIELQQAYQASARILSTARELFDTLIQSV